LSGKTFEITPDRSDPPYIVLRWKDERQQAAPLRPLTEGRGFDLEDPSALSHLRQR
jgi:hypothetical protein